jgi:hypothetical protein
MPFGSFRKELFFDTEEETEPKKKTKTSWLGGRLAVSWKAEMNSLRSDNISALSSKNQPASKDPLVRNVFMTSTSTSTITSTITLTGTLCGMF